MIVENQGMKYHSKGDKYKSQIFGFHLKFARVFFSFMKDYMLLVLIMPWDSLNTSIPSR